MSQMADEPLSRLGRRIRDLFTNLEAAPDHQDLSSLEVIDAAQRFDLDAPATCKFASLLMAELEKNLQSIKPLNHLTERSSIATAPDANASSGKFAITFDDAPAAYDASERDVEDEDEAFDTYNTQSLSSLALHNAADIVDRLYKLSYRIRNPATRLGFSQALRFRQVDPETGVDLIEALASQDQKHVQELFATWQGKPASQFANNFLAMRLAKANTRRRQQFHHWRTHRLKMERSIRSIDRPAIPHPDLSSKRSHFLLTPSEAHYPAPSQPSSATGHRDAEIDLSDRVSALSDTTYVMLSKSPDCETLTLPDLPERLRRKKEIECPYCFIMCSGATVSRRSVWYTHVMRDLRPYICIFQNCPEPDQQYDTFQSWVSHEISVHDAPSLSIKSNSTAPQSSTVLSPTESNKIEAAGLHVCPLCLEEEKSYLHISYHLQRLAYFALPTDNGADEGGGSGDANGTSGTTASLGETWSIGSQEAKTDLSDEEQILHTVKEPVSVKMQEESPEWPSLFQAIREDDVVTVEQLAPLCRLDVDFPGTNMNALAAAAHYGSANVFDFLLNTLHVEADLPDQEWGRRPLFRAAKGPSPFHSTIVRDLVARTGQDVHIDAQDREGQTALAMAADRGNFETVQILLDSGADPLIMDFQKRSAHSRARENKHQAVVELVESYVNENSVPETIPAETHRVDSPSCGESVEPETQSVPAQTGQTDSEARREIPRRHITIEEAFEDAIYYCKEILKRNEIIIGYYIYPQRTPTQVAEYEPMIKRLQTRIENLQKLDYGQLKCIINDHDCLAASYLKEYVQNIIDAAYSFKKIFVEHYNQELNRRSPYDTIPQRLEDLVHDLEDLMNDRRADLDAPIAEQVTRRGPLHFCKGAVQLINGRNTGELSTVSEEELLEPNRKLLTRYKGAFFWWQCSKCEFRVRYHIKPPTQAGTFEDCDEIRKHDEAPLGYRPIWLAKSHLRQRNDGPKTAPAKYGCLFCYGKGRKLDEKTTFAMERELAMHVCSTHITELPSVLLLNKLKVAVDDKNPEGRRWDVRLYTR